MTLTTGESDPAGRNEVMDPSNGESGFAASPACPPSLQASGGDPQNDEEQQGTRDPVAGTPASPRIARPTRKSTVVELRQGLEALGLDGVGKKESLYKRLLKAFNKAEEPEVEETPTGPGSGSAEDSYERWAERAQGDWRSFLCFDVEATCRAGKEFDWPNEIIEFPVVLLRWVDGETSPTASFGAEPAAAPGGDQTPRPRARRRLERIDTFHSYVRPTWSPVLTEFCTSLTGITQDTVDRSPTFPEMLKDLEAWMDKHDLRDEDNRLKNAMWVTDGPWDLRDFIPKQLFISAVGPPAPAYFFGQYLNIKQAVQTVLSEIWRAENPPRSPSRSSTPPPGGCPTPPKRPEARRQYLPNPAGVITTHKTMSKAYREGNWKGPNYYFNIAGQVSALDLGKFQGRQHSGLDDATNVSRILIALSEKDRVVIEPNARTPDEKHMKRWAWMGKDGTVRFEDWMSRGSDPSVAPTRMEGQKEAGALGVVNCDGQAQSGEDTASLRSEADAQLDEERVAVENAG